jgi:hypothetical protein
MRPGSRLTFGSKSMTSGGTFEDQSSPMTKGGHCIQFLMVFGFDINSTHTHIYIRIYIVLLDSDLLLRDGVMGEPLREALLAAAPPGFVLPEQCVKKWRDMQWVM